MQQIGNRELYEPALEKGDIDVVPEYAATLATFLSGKIDGKNAKDPSSPQLETTMTNLTALGEKAGLVFGKPSAAQDQNAFAATEAFADKYGVRPCPTSRRSARARPPSSAARRSARSGPSASRAWSRRTASRPASSARSTPAAR